MDHVIRYVHFVVIIWALVFITRGNAQSESQEDSIKIHRLTGGLYMLEGRGGNIGVSVGNDGVFLIDDQFAPATEAIRSAIAGITEQPIKFVLNTHWHRDHTGGNENLGRIGAIIVAHENVRRRMSTEQFIKFFDTRVPPAPPAALPVVTFSKDITFHINGDEVYVFHVDNAHTDGDVIVYFRRANVIHMGDLFFSGSYPFIDLSSGGSVQGVIDAVNNTLSMINENTKIIPGHGPVSSMADLSRYWSMLVTISSRVRRLSHSGKTLQEVIAAKPGKEFDQKWGQGLVTPEKFIGIVYEDIQRNPTIPR